ncbi:hypothetical protein K7432_003438 [Basidiobolus ranarum]|uniref:Autophagy-related protein 14 n=1 Tax=Basidiobolus ranarum TaxID=34480 RepID=A0ABR2WZW3_9FUNG
MECKVCCNVQRRFYCASCIQERVRKHQAVANRYANSIREVLDKFQVALKSSQVEGKQKHIQKQALERSLTRYKEQLEAKQKQIDIEKSRVHQLQVRNGLLRENLISARARLKASREQEVVRYETYMAKLFEKKKHAQQILAHTRRVLVWELLSLFELRQLGDDTVHPNHHHSNPFNLRCKYIIAGIYLPSNGNWPECPRDQLNAGVGHIIHMSGLMAHYLNVKLPLQVLYKDSLPYIKVALDNASESETMPLYYSDDNNDLFTAGMAMLSYNILCLCYSQGLEISPNQIHHILRNLLMCCKSNNLGRTNNNPRKIPMFNVSKVYQIIKSTRNPENALSVHEALQLNFAGEDSSEEDEDGNETWDLVEVVLPPTPSQTLDIEHWSKSAMSEKGKQAVGYLSGWVNFL